MFALAVLIFLFCFVFLRSKSTHLARLLVTRERGHAEGCVVSCASEQTDAAAVDKGIFMLLHDCGFLWRKKHLFWKYKERFFFFHSDTHKIIDKNALVEFYQVLP